VLTVAITNQKGGVGKTTTAVNLSAGLAGLGRRILLIDLDPQANATTGVGIDHRSLERSLYDCLIDDVDPAQVLRSTAYARLDILPSTIDLAGAELELVAAIARETKLRRVVERVGAYDVVVIDCPPSLGLLTVNGLTAAHKVLIPIQCEYYALEGLSQLMRNIELVRSGLNPTLDIGGIVLTMYDARTKLSEEVTREVREHFGPKVFSTIVPRSVRLSEAPSYGQPAIAYDPYSRGSKAYIWLAEEFERRFFPPRPAAEPPPPAVEPAPPAVIESAAPPWAPAVSIETESEISESQRGTENHQGEGAA
jgi:chromosome partitioning protein